VLADFPEGKTIIDEKEFGLIGLFSGTNIRKGTNRGEGEEMAENRRSRQDQSIGKSLIITCQIRSEKYYYDDFS